MEVKFKRSLCVAIDPSLVNSYQEKLPDLQVKYFDLARDLQSQGNGIGLNKDNPSLTAEVEQAVKELKKEGVVQALETKWGLQS